MYNKLFLVQFVVVQTFNIITNMFVYNFKILYKIIKEYENC